jgi:ribosomal protein S18 acetylase RimI-like enzyme
MDTRAARPSDLPAITATLTGAFATDPVWGWAFPERDRLEAWLQFWVTLAIPQGHVRLAPDAAAAAVWIPPGGAECPPEDVPYVEPLVHALAGDRDDLVLDILDRFETSHPTDLPPHHYLSFLGTAPAHRGRGVGMAVLADSLARIDREHLGAYLESSNPVNVGRYESLGFVSRGSFELPAGHGSVTMMWRDAR